MKMPVLLLTALVAVTSLGASGRTTDVTIVLTAEEFDAVTWVLSKAPEPSTRRASLLEDRTPGGYIYALVKDQLSRDVARKAEAERSVVLTKLQGLSSTQCATLAGQLGVSVTTLPCGSRR